MTAKRTVVLDTAADAVPAVPAVPTPPPEVGLPLELLTHMTILGYLMHHGRLGNYPASTLSAHGKAVASFSRSRGVPIGKVADPRFGQVNAYAVTILDEYFASLETRR